MEELLLSLAQVVYTIGPRPTLRQVLTGAADRFQKMKWPGAEAIAHTLLAYLEILGARLAEAETEIGKAHPLSERPGDELAQIVGGISAGAQEESIALDEVNKAVGEMAAATGRNLMYYGKLLKEHPLLLDQPMEMARGRPSPMA